MPRCILFAGPSLPDAADLARGSAIEVLPPVAAGDLPRLSLAPGDVVGIVDGYFHQVGTVRHKEILALLSNGVRVLGAASMGALRAAELAAFGMEGIGRIYADYRDGRLEADDEVTLLHSTPEENYRPLSEPLVCVRATLAHAVDNDVCDARTAAALIEVLAHWPYGRRSYRSLAAAAQEAGLDQGSVETLRHHCETHRLDPKRTDALLLLDALRQASQSPPAAPPAIPALNRTSFLYLWETAAAGLEIGDSPHHGHLAALRACQLFADSYPAFHRATVLDTLAAACAEECGTDPTVPATETALRHGEHRGLYRRSAPLEFLAHWLTPAELATLPRDEQITRFLVRSFRVNPGVTWEARSMQQLRTQPCWPAAQQIVKLAWTVNDQVFAANAERDVNDLSPDKILALYAARWGVARADLEAAVLDRGLESLDGLAMAGRAFYLLASYNPDRVALDLG